MSIEQRVLSTLLSHGVFDNCDSKISGIARLAIDKGFNSLSAAQKGVLSPFMSKECEGITDPGGNHNECRHVLEGEDLIGACEGSSYYEAWICESCRSEQEYYDYQWQRISEE